MEYGVLTASVSNEEGDIVNINGRRYQSQREKDTTWKGSSATRKEGRYSLLGENGDEGCK